MSWHRDNQLRGCIGTFISAPLSVNIPKYALQRCICSDQSALYDSRFRPIKLEEIEHLECSISILLDFEVIQNWKDWEIGKHGIIIEWKGFKATYLPHVADEQVELG